MSSIESAYPDPESTAPAQLADLQSVPLRHVQTTLRQTTTGRYPGHLAEAALNGVDNTAIAAIGRQHDRTNRLIAQYGDTIVRLLQAQSAYTDVFFEAVSRSYSQLDEFTSRDPLEQMLDCPPAIAWREQIKNYAPVDQLEMPEIIKNFGISVVPRVSTALPDNVASTQVGYLRASGNFIGQKQGIIAPINPKELGHCPAPLIGAARTGNLQTAANQTVQPGHRDYPRQSAALTLTKGSIPIKHMDKAVFFDGVAVVPGLFKVGNVVSTDMCIDLGWDNASKAGPYYVSVLRDGTPVNERLIQPEHDSPLIGTKYGNPHIIVPPQKPELREWPDNAPFTREQADMQLSVVGLPVTIVSSRTDPRYDAGLPSLPYQSTNTYNLLQQDRQRQVFMAHVAIVASY